MNRATVILVLLVVGFLCNLQAQGKSQDLTVQTSDAIQQCVKEFLAGKGCDAVLVYTSGGAFQEQAPKAEVIKDTYKNAQVLFSKAVILNKGTAVVAVQTKAAKSPDQFHTFVLDDSQAKGWKIKAWHTSHQ